MLQVPATRRLRVCVALLPVCLLPSMAAAQAASTYRLAVTRSLQGTVTGGGIACGPSAAACEAAIPAATSVALTVTPAPGFVFGGWTGACAGGGPTVSVLMDRDRACATSFVNVVTSPARPATVATFAASDSSGQRSAVFQPTNSNWTFVPGLNVNGTPTSVYFQVDGADGRQWVITLGKRSPGTLTPGVHVIDGFRTTGGQYYAERVFCDPTMITGRFTIHQARMVGSTIDQLAADFDLGCTNPAAPRLKGIVRFNTYVSPRAMSWGTHLLVAGAGAGGGPHVQAFSQGVSLDPHYNFLAYDPRFSGGVNVGYGDVDGDGTADVVTAPGPGGVPHVRLLTSAPTVDQPPTLREIGSFFAYDPAFFGGVNVAVGDVTGDGVAEIVTAPGAGGGPHVRVFRFAAGGFVEHAGFFAYDPGFTGGVRLAVGDVDGDGTGEIITSPGPGGGPHVQVFNVIGPWSVSSMRSFFAYDPGFTGGLFVAAGDVNGDGFADVITGADAGGGPHVRALSLKEARAISEVTSFFAYDLGFTGGVRVGAADLDLDGRAEIVAGAGRGGVSYASAFWIHATGSVSMWTHYPAYSSFTGGVFVAGTTR